MIVRVLEIIGQQWEEKRVPRTLKRGKKLFSAKKYDFLLTNNSTYPVLFSM